jgi:hypothetical protein
VSLSQTTSEQWFVLLKIEFDYKFNDFKALRFELNRLMAV